MKAVKAEVLSCGAVYYAVQGVFNFRMVKFLRVALPVPRYGCYT